MNIFPTKLEGLSVVATKMHLDARGVFQRVYCAQELSQLIGARRIVQINHSRTVEIGTVRGLHIQYPPHAEMKFVRCLKGRVWDVAVDVRKNSATYLKWHAEELSPSNARMMVIPEGFAHGFQVLEQDSELLYLHTTTYEPNGEGGFRFDDPIIGIKWPLNAIKVSPRDKNHPLITSLFQGIEI
jgi:dTDP-4-dehydrorhamnose 3,5-epimerase